MIASSPFLQQIPVSDRVPQEHNMGIHILTFRKVSQPHRGLPRAMLKTLARDYKGSTGDVCGRLRGYVLIHMCQHVCVQYIPCRLHIIHSTVHVAQHLFYMICLISHGILYVISRVVFSSLWSQLVVLIAY